MGSHIERFEIIDYLGSGAMGVVFRAKDPKLDREVALKLLRPQFRQNKAAIRRLLQEAKTMAKLKHPNVLTIYDSGEEGELVYLAMELVSGGTLGEWLKREKPGWQEIVSTFADVASGLAAAHKEGIVHRDVKPGNLLIDSRGVVRVSDFGLASESTSRAQSESSTVVGTIGYMAPEVLSGVAASEASEQFSLCVSLYEALCGQRPFGGHTRREYESSLLGDAADFSRIPQSLRPVLRRGLMGNSTARYHSMIELEQALRNASRPRLSRGVVLMGGSLVLAAILAIVLMSASSPGRAVCPRATTTVAEIWNDERSATIKKGFLASGRSHALATWTTAAGAIERYTDDWLDSQQSSCRATLVSGEQSDSLLDARTRCLQKQLHSLQSVLGYFDKADANTVDKTLAFIGSLTAPESCSADRVLRWQSPTKLVQSDIQRRSELEFQLAESESLYVLGDYVGAERVCRDILGRTNAVQDVDVIAQAGAKLGQSLLKQMQPTAATKELTTASEAAATIGDHKLAAQIWIGMAIADGYYLDKIDAGMAYLRAAKSADSNSGGLPLVEVRILQIEGLLQSSVDLSAALMLQKQALEKLRE
ncbi:MAG: serine/threonine protein kinase, partial [Kofleriaceae bacterium]|nr:serine/threonine protein kinase [Kofleriaceae bacterium]